MSFKPISGGTLNWWSKDTYEAFLERTLCMEDQYNDLAIKKANVTITKEQMSRALEEIIADNGGIREAYLAYGKL